MRRVTYRSIHPMTEEFKQLRNIYPINGSWSFSTIKPIIDKCVGGVYVNPNDKTIKTVQDVQKVIDDFKSKWSHIKGDSVWRSTRKPLNDMHGKPMCEGTLFYQAFGRDFMLCMVLETSKVGAGRYAILKAPTMYYGHGIFTLPRPSCYLIVKPDEISDENKGYLEKLLDSNPVLKEAYKEYYGITA